MAITSFRGAYSFLSNFHTCSIKYDGFTYSTSEHAFQCAKVERALRPQDSIDKDISSILWCDGRASTPGEAKRAAYKVKMRQNWAQDKYRIMEEILRIKFAPGSHLAAKLVETGTQDIIEGNTWGDKDWGCVMENGTWVGENNLGKLLMKIRKDLSSGKTMKSTVSKKIAPDESTELTPDDITRMREAWSWGAND